MIAGFARPLVSLAAPPQFPGADKKPGGIREDVSPASRVAANRDVHAASEAEAHYESAWRLGKTLEAFGNAFDRVTSRMRAIRPDITGASYDLKLDKGMLKVVGDSMDDRSRIWLEESVNGDQELVRLAKEFNQLAVEVLDPKDCLDGGRFAGSGRHYDQLETTIDRTTRFVSLLKSVGDTKPTRWWFGKESLRAAEVIEQQVISDTYEYQAKGGSIELMRRMVTQPFYALS